MRDNPDLDAFMGAVDGEGVNASPRARKKRRSPKLDRDVIKRRAFRVLALIADLDARQRAAVLRAAERLSRA